MASFAYRGVDRTGKPSAGELQAGDRTEAINRLRAQGVVPLELREGATSRASATLRKTSARTRNDLTKALAELGVLLNAGLPLDRALGLCVDNAEQPAIAAEFRRLLAGVREGTPLSRIMIDRPDLFPPSARAVIEAGEANDRLGEALTRVARTFAQAEEIRRLVSGAMIYPAALLLLAVGVILMILLYVVPQFESLFASARDKLPPSSAALMALSQGMRAHGLVLLAGFVLLGIGVRQLLSRPETRPWLDGVVLRVPQLGMLVRYIEAARLARTLGGLVEGGVPLPDALAMSSRAVGNTLIAAAMDRVATQVKQGGSLTSLVAATGALPKVAIGFFRTGEETSQLGMMLERLADVLERDVSLRIERLVAIVTPLITIVLGGSVAAIIASIMTAILGFNDLAVGQ